MHPVDALLTVPPLYYTMQPLVGYTLCVRVIFGLDHMLRMPAVVTVAVSDGACMYTWQACHLLCQSYLAVMNVCVCMHACLVYIQDKMMMMMMITPAHGRTL